VSRNPPWLTIRRRGGDRLSGANSYVLALPMLYRPTMHVVRVTELDVAAFLAFRADALAMNAEMFRVSAADDAALGEAFWRARLAHDYVVAAFGEHAWLGVGGFSRFSGSKLLHKGLIWGMYVLPQARGAGAADDIMAALLDHARGEVRQVQLTVMADNARAIAFYERHGFERYGTEPESVLRGDVYADEALMWRRLP